MSLLHEGLEKLSKTTKESTMKTECMSLLTLQVKSTLNIHQVDLPNLVNGPISHSLFCFFEKPEKKPPFMFISQERKMKKVEFFRLFTVHFG